MLINDWSLKTEEFLRLMVQQQDLIASIFFPLTNLMHRSKDNPVRWFCLAEFSFHYLESNFRMFPLQLLYWFVFFIDVLSNNLVFDTSVCCIMSKKFSSSEQNMSLPMLISNTDSSWRKQVRNMMRLSFTFC